MTRRGVFGALLGGIFAAKAKAKSLLSRKKKVLAYGPPPFEPLPKDIPSYRFTYMTVVLSGRGEAYKYKCKTLPTNTEIG